MRSVLAQTLVPGRHQVGTVAVLQGGESARDQADAPGAGLRAGPRALDRPPVRLAPRAGPSRPLQDARRRAEGIGDQDLGASARIVFVDLHQRLEPPVVEQRPRRPQRQCRVDAPARQLGPGGAVEQDRPWQGQEAVETGRRD